MASLAVAGLVTQVAVVLELEAEEMMDLTLAVKVDLLWG
tara:strand:+ start:830 stop:946 length:117 start_codon:yes stop_codon:yes gene_type:complete